MKIYLRLLNFARPLAPLAVPYFVYSLLGTAFGLVNFVLLIPLLNLLFGVSNTATPTKPSSFQRIPLIETYQQFVLQFDKTQALLIVCCTIVVSVLLANVFRYLAIRIIEFLRTQLVYKLRQAAFEKVLSFPVGYFSNERRGDLISRLTADVQEVEGTLAHNFGVLLKEPITLISYFVALFLMSPTLTGFSLVVLPISGALIAFLVKKLRDSARAGQVSLGVLLGMVDEMLGGIKVVKAFTGEQYLNRKFENENRHYTGLMRYLAYRRELAPPFSEFMGVLLAAVILFYGGSLVLSNDSPLSASEFITYIVLFTQITKPAKDLSQVFSNLQRGLAAGTRVLELIDSPAEANTRPGAKALTSFTQSIDFQSVSFAYEEKEVLKNISFTLQKGKTVALVGSTGSGKSTIADLIPRFYDVKAGTITLDGVDLRDYTLDSLRSQLGIVTQDPILFNDTIFNNIAFGNPDARLEDVMRAAEIANAHEFILQKEEGYQFVIGDRGVKLSGGQRQRLSIARAVFKNPPILILDEATSNLDTISEKLVQEALTRLMQSRTVLVIAHRLSTIQHADQILVVSQGEIVERGNHETLLQNENGYYKKLSVMQ